MLGVMLIAAGVALAIEAVCLGIYEVWCWRQYDTGASITRRYKQAQMKSNAIIRRAKQQMRQAAQSDQDSLGTWQDW